MKARHKQEAVEAIKLGADLNHPSGLIPERDGEDDDEDEDEPLANLPTRGGAGSMVGGMDGNGSMIGGMQQQQAFGPGAMGMGMGVGFGGAYSPLAMAPFGVDPYLCKLFSSSLTPAVLIDKFSLSLQTRPSRSTRRCLSINDLNK
jgi:hypothetical protein